MTGGYVEPKKNQRAGNHPCPDSARVVGVQMIPTETPEGLFDQHSVSEIRNNARGKLELQGASNPLGLKATGSLYCTAFRSLVKSSGSRAGTAAICARLHRLDPDAFEYLRDLRSVKF
jgi:hypothetical protein